MIDLEKFAKENKAKEFTYKGNTRTINWNSSGKTYELNNIQKAHINKELNVYAPIECYSEQWRHVTDKKGNHVSAYPIPGTKKKDNLPPVAEQWKRDFAKNLKRNKTNV